MNNKLTKGIIIFTVLIFIAALFYFLYSKKDSVSETGKESEKVIELMTTSEINSIGLYHLGVYEVLSRDENGKPLSYRLINVKEEQEIPLEFMSEEEKAAKNFSEDYKIQVLQRDENGKVIAYRIIKDENDVLKKY